MTVPVQPTHNTSTAAAGATVFPYGFKIISAADLLVQVNGVTKTLGVDYTVSDVGNETGGNVTFIVPLAGGESVLRKRNMVYQRLNDYQSLGDFRSPTVNGDFDAAVMMIQQIADTAARSLRINDAVSGVETLLAAPLPGRAIIGNEAGTGFTYGDENIPAEAAAQAAANGVYATLEGVGYQVPVAYTSGISITMLGNTVDYNGDIYAPLASALPFTTSGMFETTKFRLIVPGQFIQSGTGAVVRTVQNKARDTLSVSDFGAVGDGVTDDNNAVMAAINGANGRIVYFPAGDYVVGALLVPSNTTIVFAPGVKLRKRLNAGRILYLLDVENVTIHGNGVWLYGTDYAGSTSFGHTVTINGAKRCTISNVNIDGASTGGAGKDNVYIGKGTAASEDIVLRGGKWINAKRNGISIVSSKRALIDGVEIANAVGAPGAGVDVEANLYYENVDNTIQNCVIHNNQAAGVFSVFGSRTTIQRCQIYNNGAYGIGVSSGGAEFNDGVYRSQLDMTGCSAFDIATGVITVGMDLKDLPVGTPVNFGTRNSAVKPGGLGTIFYIVSRHVGTNGVIVGTSTGYAELTSFSTAATGTLTADPATSDIFMRCFLRDQSDGYLISDNLIYGNGTQGIFLIGSGSHIVRNNWLWNNAGNQIQVSSTANIDIIGNRIFNTGDYTATNVAGMSLSAGGGRLVVADNILMNIRGKGISITNWTGAEITRNTLWNCALAESSSNKAAISLESGIGYLVARNRIRQSESNSTTLFGIYAPAATTNSKFLHNDCTGAGTTNTNALCLISTVQAASEGNVLRDGTTVHLSGAKTFDWASLAAGAVQSTTVSVPGAAVGDYATVSMSVSLGGTRIWGEVTSTNTVTVYQQNPTASPVDVASGALKAVARKS